MAAARHTFARRGVAARRVLLWSSLLVVARAGRGSFSLLPKFFHVKKRKRFDDKMGTSSSKKKKAAAAVAARPGGEVTEVDRQVLGLKTQRRRLAAYAKRVDDAVARETITATTLAKSGQKAKALNALKRRKAGP